MLLAVDAVLVGAWLVLGWLAAARAYGEGIFIT